jgi:autotransporter-associated beta strand protein
VGNNQIALNGVTVSSTGTTGLIDVTDGFLSIEAATAMNTATSTGSITVQSGRAMQFFQNTGIVNWPMTFKGNNNIGNASATSATVASPMILQGNVTLVPLTAGAPVVASNFPLVLNGNISDSGGPFGITKAGINTVTLGGSNTYQGATAIQEGTLIVTKSYSGGGGLNISDSALLQLPHSAATPNNVVYRASSFTTNTTGKIDLSDNKLIVVGGTVGTPAGGFYDGITGRIQSGRTTSSNWSGSGIVTSQTQASNGSNYTSVGIATGAQVVPSSATATATWAGQTITGTDALVMYTYGGDANLDGKINIDDYGHIDTSIGIGLTGWFNGDFNYDGIINIDDYGIIDVNIGIQGPAFPTGAGAGGAAASSAGLTAVPEPGGLAGVLFIAASAFSAKISRRRRRFDGST